MPAARNVDGSTVTGPVLARLSSLSEGSSTASLETGYAGLRYQRPATLDTARALLTMQASDDAQQVPIARVTGTRVKFSDTPGGPVCRRRCWASTPAARWPNCSDWSNRRSSACSRAA